MKKILIMAGGTGGHVFPGLAVAKELSKNDEFEVLWLGTKERMESVIVPKNGFNIKFIKIQGIRRNGILRKIFAPFKILRAVYEAIQVIREFKPNVVLGMGGYASGPGGLAAKILGIPLVLHEQNAAPGLTNRLLAKIATKILLGLPKAFAGSNVLYVGNPVRKEVADLNKLLPREFPVDKIRVLIVGGSLGAQILNEVVPKAISLCRNNGINIEVLHQTGKGNSIFVKKMYEDLSIVDGVIISDFIDDMAQAYCSSDIIICRAGASTVAEVSAVGIPAIFVPLPSAVDDHQTKNAQSLSDIGGAICLAQKDLSSEVLAKHITELASDKSKLSQMSKIVGEVAKLTATQDAAAVCRELSGE
jgi:UDP-N-acetylglucosamine--N-acetylmuramyl-(pentapeptide) pyrophosphoryl-undecaprenol N-acetylglucosamine transferase